MLDPKIAEAAFKLRKNELSRPVEGQFSVVLLRVPEIEAGKKRTFEEVKGEIRDRIAGERVGQQFQALQEQIEAGRGKGTPLKEIAEKLKLPFQEIAAINRTGKTAEGKASIAHADAAKLIEAFFGATAGVETEGSGAERRRLCLVRPPRHHAREAADICRGRERGACQLHGCRAAQGDGEPGRQADRAPEGWRKAGRDCQGARRESRAHAPTKRSASRRRRGCRRLPCSKHSRSPRAVPPRRRRWTGSRSRSSAWSTSSLRPRQPPSGRRLKADLAKQLRIDLLEQYVAGLRTRYGFTVNEKALMQALGQRGKRTRTATTERMPVPAGRSVP